MYNNYNDVILETDCNQPSFCINPLISEISVPEIQPEIPSISSSKKILNYSVTSLTIAFNTIVSFSSTSLLLVCPYIPTHTAYGYGGINLHCLWGIMHKCSQVPCYNNMIHTTCGHSVDGMDGHGCAAWCVTCWIDNRETNIRQGRRKAKETEQTNPKDGKA